MKNKILSLILFLLSITHFSFAQNKTIVEAKNQEISDNLDLRAVASIFGESRDLEDFERRLNDPKTQISNLDLNYDNQVDYLRVVEVVDRDTHLITIQAIIGKDLFQDVATIEIEKREKDQVQIQIVGNIYMYGNNYIYEPIYVRRPTIFNIFWLRAYRPYYSPWYWGHHPAYYYGWRPYPIYRYRNNINVYINTNNRYNYVTTRRSNRAVTLQNSYRRNDYEKQYPNHSFSRRNNNITNRYELNENRRNSTSNNSTYRSNTTTSPERRGTNNTRTTTTSPERRGTNNTRTTTAPSVRSNTNTTKPTSTTRSTSNNKSSPNNGRR